MTFRSTFLLLSFCIGLASQPVEAQTSVDLERYRTPYDRFGFLGFQGTYLPKQGQLNLGTSFNYSRRPWVTHDSSRGTDIALIHHRLISELYVQIGLGGSMSLALDFPVALVQTGHFSLPEVGTTELPLFAIGDPRLAFRVQALGGRDDGPEGLGLAFLAGLTFPVGTDRGLLSEQAVTTDLQATLDFHIVSGLGAGLMLSHRHRFQQQEITSIRFRDELGLGLGLKVPIPVAVDFYGQVGFSLSTDARSPFAAAATTQMEARLGLNYLIGDVAVGLTGGFGFGDGIGTPRFRTILQLDWAPRKHDADGDGISDRHDQCIYLPEDFDGFEDEDGCGEPDNDLDGILDADDQCPNDAAPPEDDPDEDGCI